MFFINKDKIYGIIDTKAGLKNYEKILCFVKKSYKNIFFVKIKWFCEKKLKIYFFVKNLCFGEKICVWWKILKIYLSCEKN